MAFIALGPAYGQLVRGAHAFAPHWIMFSGIAFNLFEVSLETIDATGARVPVDRFETLGYARRADAPRDVITVRSDRDATHLARRICRATGNAPLFMHVRKAARRGWKITDDGTRDHCAHDGRRK
jgi:hypothetical protein